MFWLRVPVAQRKSLRTLPKHKGHEGAKALEQNLCVFRVTSTGSKQAFVENPVIPLK
jgi:hypothetical protein